MPIEFRCECGKTMKAPERLQGELCRCPACGREFVVPFPGRPNKAEDVREQSLEERLTEQPNGPRNSPRTEQSDSHDNPPGAAGDEAVESLAETVPSDRYGLVIPIDESTGPEGFDSEGNVVFAEAPAPTAGPAIASQSFFAPASEAEIDEQKQRRKKRKADREKIDRPREEPRHLVSSWTGSFMFPFWGEGKWTVLMWTVVFGGTHGLLVLLFSVLLFAGLLGVVMIAFIAIMVPVMIICLGHFGSYLLDVLRSACQGEDELPSTNQGLGIAGDLFHWLVCLLVGMAPLFIYLSRCKTTGQPIDPVIYWICVGIAVFYVPMAVLAVALFDTVLAANPLLVMEAIFRIPLQYFATCSLILGIIVLESLFEEYVPSVPFLSQIVVWFAAVYVLIVAMHLLGTVYYRNRESIGWFRSE